METIRPVPRSCRIDGLEIAWDRRVLRPRPWTSMQSEWAAELHPSVPPGPLLELCCGVGHIGLVAALRTSRRATLVDADDVACGHARRNAARAGLSGRVTVVRHLIDGRRVPHCPTAFPLVLADPPYVPTREAGDDPGDPAFAVDGGDDGLDVVSRVLGTAAGHLDPGGTCLLQVRGATQADAVATALRDGWAHLGLVPTETREVDELRAVQRLIRVAPS